MKDLMEKYKSFAKPAAESTENKVATESIIPPELFNPEEMLEYVKKAKKANKYIQHADNTISGIGNKGIRSTAMKLAQNIMKDQMKINNLFKAHQFSKYHSKLDMLVQNKPGGSKMLGSKLQKTNKALSGASFGINTIKAIDGLKNDEQGQAVKHSVDALSDGLGMTKNPVALAFSGGYEGMKFINESTDNALPDAIYSGFGFKEIKQSEGTDNEMKMEKRGIYDGLLGMKINNIKSLERYIKRIQGKITGIVPFRDGLIENLSKEGVELKLPKLLTEMPDLSIVTNPWPANLDQHVDNLLIIAEKIRDYYESINFQLKIVYRIHEEHMAKRDQK
ncbi:hypothetical protein [Portibacter lacus]|uniref:Uncharacterized protein n=1 Tax=Portibacter lacus TaxID=1099794 RepID=A0AA37STJ6_9BACT|nr:hypothetical protein [Portibacter lacus]GLR17943.1 hypothetical protein GCM10007940_25580 [Portibacter lacus]